MDLSLDQFEIIRTIGVGSFSHVELAFHIPSQIYCVLKIMSKERIIELNQKEHVINEVYTLRDVQHPFVVTLHGTFQDDRNVYLMQEFIAGGEVFSHLRTLQCFDLDVTRFYAAEILLVFQMLHSKGYVYRDLKPENLVFNAEGHIKFIDFGFAKRIVDRTYTLCGTPEYLAPEIIRGEGSSFCSDWWAYGILIYEFLVGQTPFVDENENKMYQKICRGQVYFPDYIDPITADFLEGLLTVDATHRLGCTAIGAEEIKQHQWFQGIDWSKVYHMRYQPPLVPIVEDDGDSSNFADYSDPATIQEVVATRPFDVYFEGF
ncbi:Pkinase-domain-containing protein [Histomonas meleagridis]|uniref:Pkinase-domain-containing protein n=1 Tax=Histomonas meleagridis TaxID=135588 RepID=UPI003559F196|nr:Pkinase-domain-containing protein [Histomonas meleagridis]KAH0803850.1 Pkinase-domain-containing protein [Histomonas meleagridis]